nr:unnamed protein product [Spirometra erinaceieuropaei]
MSGIDNMRENGAAYAPSFAFSRPYREAADCLVSMNGSEKVQKIESFINDRLRGDLRATLEAGDAVYAEISEYLELQNLLEKFSEMKVKNANLDTMVDIGCNFYVKAKVVPEALAYIKERTELLNDRAELFRKKSFEIKARIKVCLEGLREVQSLNVEERPDYHDALS